MSKQVDRVTQLTLDRWVKEAHDTGARIDKVDTEVSKLQIRIGRSGKITYRLNYRARGSKAKSYYAIGTSETHTLAEARKRAGELNTDVANRSDPVQHERAEQRRKKHELTFEVLATRWLEEHAVPNKAPAAVYDDRLMLKNDVLPAIGKIHVSEITKREVVDLVKVVVTSGRGVRANRVLALVRSIFRWGVADDLIATNPSEGVKKRTKEKPRERVLTEDEVRLFWRTVEDDEAPISEPLKLALKLALVTGQRIGMVMGMARAELDLAKATWTVPAEYPFGVESVVPLRAGETLGWRLAG